MSAPSGLPFGLFDWIAANAADFEPPVSNKVVFESNDLIFMIIRGPNARSDFHIDPFDEIFLQLRGSVRVDLIVDGVRQEHWVEEGQVMMVPAGVPHSPLRPADTWGLVVERPRPSDQLDAVEWYCEECAARVRRVEFHISDIESELAAALELWNTDASLRVCPNGHANPAPTPFVA